MADYGWIAGVVAVAITAIFAGVIKVLREAKRESRHNATECNETREYLRKVKSDMQHLQQQLDRVRGDEEDCQDAKKHLEESLNRRERAQMELVVRVNELQDVVIKQKDEAEVLRTRIFNLEEHVRHDPRRTVDGPLIKPKKPEERR